VASVVRKSGNSLGRFTGFLLRAFDEMPYDPCNGDIRQSPVELLPTLATLSGCLLPLRALLRIEQRYVGQSTAWLHSSGPGKVAVAKNLSGRTAFIHRSR